MKRTKQLFFLLLLTITLGACGVNEQVDQLKALEKCTFSIKSADSIYLANTDVSKIIGSNGFNLRRAPALALAMMQQSLPLKGRVHFEITNPGAEEAAINEFEYRVLIKDTELASGVTSHKISIAPNGGTTVVPVKIEKNLYPVLSDRATQQAIADFLSQDTLKKVTLTIKVKPSFLVADKLVNYPGFIDINREISNREMLQFLKGAAYQQ